MKNFSPLPIRPLHAREIADVLEALDAALPLDADTTSGKEFNEGLHISLDPIRVTTDFHQPNAEPEVLGWIVFGDFGPEFTTVDPRRPNVVVNISSTSDPAMTVERLQEMGKRAGRA